MMNIMNKTELKSILDAPPSCIIWKRTVVVRETVAQDTLYLLTYPTVRRNVYGTDRQASPLF